MSRFLVTGCAGFIGSWVAQRLMEQGHEVRGIDNFHSGDRRNICTGHDFEFIEGDLRDASIVARACGGIECIFHQAAIPSVALSVSYPKISHAANLNATLNLLEGARVAGVRRVVFASSSAAYGDHPQFPRRECMVPMPKSPYAVQKVASELYMKCYWESYGLETVALRYFNVFGPRQNATSEYSGVISLFATRMIGGRPPIIYGDGKQTRDFVYVDDVVSANLLAAAAPADKVAGKVFNIGCAVRYSLIQIHELIADILGFRERPLFGPPRQGDIRDSIADITAAREALGYEPQISFTDGLMCTLDWYKQPFRAGTAVVA